MDSNINKPWLTIKQSHKDTTYAQEIITLVFK